MRWLIPVVLLLAWLFFANSWLSNKKSECCSGAANSTAAGILSSDAKAAVKVANESGPILFSWSDCKPQAQANWDRFRDSIIRSLPQDYLLDIKVWSYKAEKNICKGADLAADRTEEIRAMFTKHIKSDKLRLTPSTRTDKQEDWKSYLFQAASFNYAFDGEFVKEIDDKALIYFPVNSSKKISNKQIDDYLKQVASRIKKTGESVALTGHTDDSGEPDTNLTLGLRRANHVRDILMRMGVPASQIAVSSLGETDPIAANDTESGRQKNRRTELKVNKSK